MLAVLAVVAGFLQAPAIFGAKFAWLGTFLGTALPPVTVAHPSTATELILQILSAAASLGGILLAYLLYRRPSGVERRAPVSPVVGAVERFWTGGWGFDWLYARLFIQPYFWLAHIDRHDIIDYFYSSLGWLSTQFHEVLSASETGKVRWYAAGVAIGALIVLAILVWR